MSKHTSPQVVGDVQHERAPYEAPRLIVHGSVAAMTQAQPSSPRASDLVEAEVTFLGPNA